MTINGRFMSEPETQAYINSLLARIAELEERHFSDCAQIAHYSDELRKANELLSQVRSYYGQTESWVDLYEEQYKELMNDDT